MSVSVYRKNQSAVLTQEFESTGAYGKIKAGDAHLFWKKGLSWKYVSVDEIKRIYRRVEGADSTLGCCNVSFDIQKLVLELKDGTICELLIGEGLKKEAEALYADLKMHHSEIMFGKVSS